MAKILCVLYDDPVAGVAWGYALTTCLALFLPYMVFCLRLAGVSPTAWARQLLRPALATLGMGAAVFAAQRSLAQISWLPPLAVLMAQITVGVAVYTALAWRDIRWCLDRLRRF